jgi:hypothetical protein
MSQAQRNQRLRLLLRRLNQQRRQQAHQIDILCHDLIGAQRSFLHRLQDIGFAAEFYRALLGGADLHSLLSRARRAIRQELPGVEVLFYLRQPDGCEFHACPEEEALSSECRGPQDCLDPELLDRICKHNRPCTLDEVLALNTGGDLQGLREYSLVTLPLSDLGRSLGFVLLYCPRPQVLDPAQVRRVGAVLCGLARTVRTIGIPLPSRR